MEEKQPKALDIAKRLEFHSAMAEGQNSLTYSVIDAAKELRRLYGANAELLDALNDLLDDIGRASSMTGARKARAVVANNRMAVRNGY